MCYCKLNIFPILVVILIVLEEFKRIGSITELHEKLGIEKPKNPLLSVVPASELIVTPEMVGIKIIQDYYMISLKDKSCGLEYGRDSIDFDEGVMAFYAPGQVYIPMSEVKKGQINGYLLYFDPGLIKGTTLSQAVSNYSFFDYEVTEGLHLSVGEEQAVIQSIKDIQSESENKHINQETIAKLEQLLHFCSGFYERQFTTRSHKSRVIVSQFEKELRDYFVDRSALDKGLPLIEYFSQKANLSQNYFSDLIKKETGRAPKDHINEFIVERAKSLLVGSSRKVSEIAYNLGFNYPHYFIRLFKSKTGYTPLEYRNLN